MSESNSAPAGWRFPPRTIFHFLLLAHVLVWTLVPSALGLNAPLDVVELVGWGHEWQWGYYKHPPLAAWLAEVFFAPFAPQVWPLYLLSQLCVAACFWAVWRLGCALLDEQRALLSVLLLEGSYYFSLTSVEFNVNVLQLPLWALVCLLAWRALQRDKLIDWILLALAAALAILAKYFAAMLLACAVGLLLFTVEGRRKLRRPGPWVALAAFALAIAPHVAWLVQNDFPTFHYALSRAQAEGAAASRLTAPLRFIGAQLFSLAPSLLLVAVLLGPRRIRPTLGADFRERFLLWLGVGPFALAVALSLLFGWQLKSMWGTPLWTLSGILLVAFFQPSLTRENVSRFSIALCALVGLLLMAYVAPLTVGPHVARKLKRELFPGQAMAEFVTAEWHSRYKKRLSYVLGDTWLASNVHFYCPDRPLVFTEGELSQAPYVDPTNVAESGAVLVWSAAESPVMPEHLRNKFPNAVVLPTAAFPYRAGRQPPFRLGWAVLPPKAAR